MSRKPTVDEMVSAVWIAHGIVMNGGVLHAVEALAPDELGIATAGYRRFGFSGAANAFAEAQELAKSASEAEESRLDRDYARWLCRMTPFSQAQLIEPTHPEVNLRCPRHLALTR